MIHKGTNSDNYLSGDSLVKSVDGGLLTAEGARLACIGAVQLFCAERLTSIVPMVTRIHEQNNATYLVQQFEEGHAPVMGDPSEVLAVAESLAWVNLILSEWTGPLPGDRPEYQSTEPAIAPVHYDCHPQNVIIRPTGTAVIIDFGSIRLGTVEGSVSFAAHRCCSWDEPLIQKFFDVYRKIDHRLSVLDWHAFCESVYDENERRLRYCQAHQLTDSEPKHRQFMREAKYHAPTQE